MSVFEGATSRSAQVSFLCCAQGTLLVGLWETYAELGIGFLESGEM